MDPLKTTKEMWVWLLRDFWLQVLRNIKYFILNIVCAMKKSHTKSIIEPNLPLLHYCFFLWANRAWRLTSSWPPKTGVNFVRSKNKAKKHRSFGYFFFAILIRFKKCFRLWQCTRLTTAARVWRSTFMLIGISGSWSILKVINCFLWGSIWRVKKIMKWVDRTLARVFSLCFFKPSQCIWLFPL